MKPKIILLSFFVILGNLNAGSIAATKDAKVVNMSSRKAKQDFLKKLEHIRVSSGSLAEKWPLIVALMEEVNQSSLSKADQVEIHNKIAKAAQEISKAASAPCLPSEEKVKE